MFLHISSSPRAVSTPKMMPLQVLLLEALLARTLIPQMSVIASRGSSGLPMGTSAATTFRRKFTRTRTTPSTVARSEEMASCVQVRKFIFLLLGRNRAVSTGPLVLDVGRALFGEGRGTALLVAGGCGGPFGFAFACGGPRGGAGTSGAQRGVPGGAPVEGSEGNASSSLFTASVPMTQLGTLPPPVACWEGGCFPFPALSVACFGLGRAAAASGGITCSPAPVDSMVSEVAGVETRAAAAVLAVPTEEAAFF